MKKDEFIPKPYKPLLPSSLRKLGAVFAVVASGIRNLSKANTIASQALSLVKIGAIGYMSGITYITTYRLLIGYISDISIY